MATANLAVYSTGVSVPISGKGLSKPSPAVKEKPPRTSFHRIAEVRQQQGMSLRTAARQLQTDIPTVRAQEQGSANLLLSDLYRWRAILEVPVADLLEESADPLSRPIGDRAKMVRIMKTAAALLEAAPNAQIRRMAENLTAQLIDLMPELKEVAGWHTVGQRRTHDELGRIAEQPIHRDCFAAGDLSD